MAESFVKWRQETSSKGNSFFIKVIDVFLIFVLVHAKAYTFNTLCKYPQHRVYTFVSLYIINY